MLYDKSLSGKQHDDIYLAISAAHIKIGSKIISQFGCVLFPRRRRGNNTKEQPFCIISNTHQNWEKIIKRFAVRCALMFFRYG